MRANPGGQISPSEVIGRDALIQRLWDILERQSLVLCAERRMGKTCLIKKMEEGAPQDKLPIYRDLESVHTTLEFVETVFRDVERYLGGLQRGAKRARQFLAQLGGTEVGGVIKIPDIAAPQWKDLLARTIEDLVEHQDRTVILFWDEVPLMLDNIRKRNSENEAMEVLDTLQSLRQMHPELRMVFTGSIGLHNVITSLKRAGYSNDPTNDMHTMDVPPLSSAEAQDLAHRLLEGEDIPTDDPQATAQAIADSVDCIPYYIHHVVDQMKYRDDVTDAATAGEIVDACLTDPLDPWHMRHYLERIGTYYMTKERPFVLNLLDILAASDEPLPFHDLFNLLKSSMETEDSDMVRDMLTLLHRDHYVVLQSDGTYRFRFPLIRRWWRLDRGMLVTTGDSRRPDAAASIPQDEVAGEFDVFLCYNSEEKPAVKEIGERLKEQRVLPWLDEWEARPGQLWQRLLEQQIEHIKSAAVFIGQSGIGPWQQLELDAFLREFINRGCPVIPVLLPDAPKEPKLPIFLKSMTWVDFRRDDPDPMGHLIWGITGKRQLK